MVKILAFWHLHPYMTFRVKKEGRKEGKGKGGEGRGTQVISSKFTPIKFHIVRFDPSLHMLEFWGFCGS